MHFIEFIEAISRIADRAITTLSDPAQTDTPIKTKAKLLDTNTVTADGTMRNSAGTGEDDPDFDPMKIAENL